MIQNPTNPQSAPERPVRILIVDDDAGMLQTLTYILTEKDYDVETVKDGFDAIERITEKSYDVVLTDIKMPGINGVEVLKEINKSSPGTIIVMMTAYTLPELVERAKREGALAVLPKPLDLDKLIAFIEECRTQKPILILDDDLDFCKTFQSINEKGYHTVFVTKIDEAIDLVLKSKFHVIFLDMKLRNVTGLDALIAIRKVDPKIIAILITGYQEEMVRLRETSLSKTVYACLYKPLDIDRLLELLKDIERKKMQQLLGEY